MVVVELREVATQLAKLLAALLMAGRRAQARAVAGILLGRPGRALAGVVRADLQQRFGYTNTASLDESVSIANGAVLAVVLLAVVISLVAMRLSPRTLLGLFLLVVNASHIARDYGTNLIGAMATAAGFLCFLPTDYRGIAELGKIAGAGMLVAFVSSITALPAMLKLLHPPGGVEDARLPGVERVARRRDLDVDDGIGVAVLPGDGAFAGRSRPGEEGVVRRAVAENDRMVVRVDSLLHDYRSSRNSTWRPITGSYLRMTRRSGSFLRLFLVTYV